MDEKETPDDFDENEKPDSYKVGYGKPPKHTRFQKGVSGNPKGRPKRPADFFAELLQEANSLITINDNGRRIRIPKFKGIARLATNKALTGNNSALKTFHSLYLQALERAALSPAQQSSDSGKYDDVKNLSREQLMRIAAAGLDETKKKKEKVPNISTD